MYTLKRGSKTVGFYSGNTSYVIGFKSVVHARSVQYSLNPNPKFMLLKSEPVFKDELVANMESTLFIPKCKGSALDPMNDIGLHLNKVELKDYYMLPHKGVGILIGYDLVYEDQYDFIFRVHAITAQSS